MSLGGSCRLTITLQILFFKHKYVQEARHVLFTQKKIIQTKNNLEVRERLKEIFRVSKY